MHRLRSIAIEPPADLRDVVWTPAELTLANGGQTVGLIPTRYAGSETSADPAVRLARKTVWLDQGDELFFGQGQRMLATDAGEHPLMAVRQIDFAAPAGSEAEPAADPA
jgi:type VI secretion system protein ImpE